MDLPHHRTNPVTVRDRWTTSHPIPHPGWADRHEDRTIGGYDHWDDALRYYSGRFPSVRHLFYTEDFQAPYYVVHDREEAHMDPRYMIPDPLTYPYETYQHVYGIEDDQLPILGDTIDLVKREVSTNPDRKNVHVLSQTLVKRYSTFGQLRWKPYGVEWEDNDGRYRFMSYESIRDPLLRGFVYGRAETYKPPRGIYSDVMKERAEFHGRRINIIMASRTWIHTIVGWADYHAPHPPWTVKVPIPNPDPTEFPR